MLFNLVITFELGGQVLSGAPSGVHGADKFLYINIVVGGCAVSMEVWEHFNWSSMCDTQKFTAKSGKPFGVNGMDDLGSCDLDATLMSCIP